MKIDVSDPSKHGRSVPNILISLNSHSRIFKSNKPTFEAGAKLRKPRELMMSNRTKKKNEKRNLALP